MRYQLVAYDSKEEAAEDPMLSEPICLFAIPIVLMGPQTGHCVEYNALINSGCICCLISRSVVMKVGIRVRQLANPVQFKQVDGSLLRGLRPPL